MFTSVKSVWKRLRRKAGNQYCDAKTEHGSKCADLVVNGFFLTENDEQPKCQLECFGSAWCLGTIRQLLSYMPNSILIADVLQYPCFWELDGQWNAWQNYRIWPELGLEPSVSVAQRLHRELLHAQLPVERIAVTKKAPDDLREWKVRFFEVLDGKVRPLGPWISDESDEVNEDNLGQIFQDAQGELEMTESEEEQPPANRRKWHVPTDRDFVLPIHFMKLSVQTVDDYYIFTGRPIGGWTLAHRRGIQPFPLDVDPSDINRRVLSTEEVVAFLCTQAFQLRKITIEYGSKFRTADVIPPNRLKLFRSRNERYGDSKSGRRGWRVLFPLKKNAFAEHPFQDAHRAVGDQWAADEDGDELSFSVKLSDVPPGPHGTYTFRQIQEKLLEDQLTYDPPRPLFRCSNETDPFDLEDVTIHKDHEMVRFRFDNRRIICVQATTLFDSWKQPSGYVYGWCEGKAPYEPDICEKFYIIPGDAQYFITESSMEHIREMWLARGVRMFDLRKIMRIARTRRTVLEEGQEFGVVPDPGRDMDVYIVVQRDPRRGGVHLQELYEQQEECRSTISCNDFKQLGTTCFERICWTSNCQSIILYIMSKMPLVVQLRDGKAEWDVPIYHHALKWNHRPFAELSGYSLTGWTHSSSQGRVLTNKEAARSLCADVAPTTLAFEGSSSSRWYPLKMLSKMQSQFLDLAEDGLIPNRYVRAEGIWPYRNVHFEDETINGEAGVRLLHKFVLWANPNLILRPPLQHKPERLNAVQDDRILVILGPGSDEPRNRATFSTVEEFAKWPKIKFNCDDNRGTCKGGVELPGGFIIAHSNHLEVKWWLEIYSGRVIFELVEEDEPSIFVGTKRRRLYRLQPFPEIIDGL